jgi:hypothetical protein
MAVVTPSASAMEGKRGAAAVASSVALPVLTAVLPAAVDGVLTLAEACAAGAMERTAADMMMGAERGSGTVGVV